MEDGEREHVAEQIDAMPTKAFFVDMLVRDIPLERAILDLVDNCVDGAKRLRDPAGQDFSNLRVDVSVTPSEFRITDTCGGFDSKTAKSYAFRFGRPSDAGQTAYSIGQFGVGMKRALFKFGRKFILSSTTEFEKWSVSVDVDQWEQSNEWSFSFSSRESGLNLAEANRGTVIVVTNLRKEVSEKFGMQSFQRLLSDLIRTHQRQFIAKGLEIRLNGELLSSTNVEVLVGNITPALEKFNYDAGEDSARVRIKLIAGVGASSPNLAGWYVVCNGRVVLAADRSDTTGWGLVAEHPAEIPKYHNQFARFRGIVYFECEDAALLPWNTTKTGVDADSPVWRITLERMIVMSRAVIDFLNEVDIENEEAGGGGPLQKALASSSKVQVETIEVASAFQAPDRSKYVPEQRKIRISYSKPADEIAILMEAFGVRTAKAVGERCFEIALKEERD